jgi:glycosyltransferase involved in cell wall biosynthesis
LACPFSFPRHITIFMVKIVDKMKKRIGIFFPHPLNGSLGSIRRVIEIAKQLKTQLETQVIIYSPYESLTKEYVGVITKTIPSIASELHLSGAAYSLSRMVYYSKFFSRSLLPLMLTEISKTIVDAMVELMRKDQISFLQVEHDFSLPLCLDVGKRLGIPVIADVHNITPEELVSAGVVAYNDNTYTKLQKLLSDVFGEVDLICVVNDYMSDYIVREYKLAKEKIIVVSPGAHLKNFRASFPNIKKVVFAGTVTYRENVELFVKSIPLITQEQPYVNFYITKKGDQINNISRLAKNFNAKINWFWHPSEDTFFDFLSSASIGILTSKNDEARRLGTPIKLLDYMSVGLPIVANDIGGWTKIITDEKLGVLTMNDPQDFATAIIGILKDDQMQNIYSNNAKKAIEEKFNWNKTTEPLIRAYENLS